MVKNKEEEVSSINLLSAGTMVKGEIKVNGDFDSWLFHRNDQL